MSNIISHKPDLSDVTMPLIRMLAQPGLSWAQRGEISQAIGACERHWGDMEKERQMLNQQNSAGQAQPSANFDTQASAEFLRTHPQYHGLSMRGHYP